MPASSALLLLACCLAIAVGHHLLGRLRHRRATREIPIEAMSPADREKVFLADAALHVADGLTLGGGIGAAIIIAALYALSR